MIENSLCRSLILLDLMQNRLHWKFGFKQLMMVQMDLMH